VNDLVRVRDYERDIERLLAERAAAAELPPTERDLRLAGLDRRLAFAEATRAAVTALGPDRTPEGVVAFATWVTVEDDEGAARTWRTVAPTRRTPGAASCRRTPPRRGRSSDAGRARPSRSRPPAGDLSRFKLPWVK
jgi:hypothetical protein